jgi:hypothetical protein
VPAAAARALLVEAFLREAAPDWLPEAAAAEMERLLGSWLERGA